MIATAWDTEGIDRPDGSHHTAMIARVGRDEKVMEDAAGLDTVRLLRFIHDGLTGEGNRTHVSFAFGYDVNMIVGDLPRRRIAELWETGYTTHAGFRLHYRPRKVFGLWKDGSGGFIWDIFGFCQSSFVAALRKYGIDAPVDEIERMKNLRGEFDPRDMPEMREYCLRECRALRLLAERIASDFREADLHLTRFDGAGAAASALLRREGIMYHHREMPARVELAARHAYFGGRIECVRYGNTNQRIYGYDINSAYPAIAANLPCLAHSVWKRTGVFDPNTFSVWRVRWDMPAGYGLMPFPWRDKSGAIYFPPRGEGWYWTPEVAAAQGPYEIVDGWTLDVKCKCRPFGFLPELYDTRKQWKAEGRGAEKALKLAINSVYGKLAQRVGSARYHQLAWAGWITSATRAALYRAAMQQPEHAIMLATDAVYSTAPLSLPLSDSLGDWEATEYDGATVVQSGVYWLGDTTTPSGSRGFDAASLDRSAIVAAWRAGQRVYRARHRAFRGMGLALRGRWDEWRRWHDDPRDLSLHPSSSKRRANANGAKPHAELVRTQPTQPELRFGSMSAPTVRPWDAEDIAATEECAE